MRFIKKQLSLWSIVLIIGMAGIVILIAARVSPTAKAVVKERQDYLDQKTTAHNEDAYAKHSKDSKAAVGLGVARPQDDYYDRRREYWDKRIERRLDRREEYLDEQTVDDNNAADAKDSKAAKDKDSKDAAADEDYADDNADKEIERRREYWRQRLEKEW
jgi:uncharacterized membrane protein YdfJ with MMPL/SSD domain